MASSIRQAAQTCLQDLQNALNSQNPVRQRTWIQRRIVDFNTWAALAGVFREGIYSLDAKLCLRPDLRKGLINLLHVFNALMSPNAVKSVPWSEIEDKFSEIVSVTVYLRRSLADTGLWPDEDSAQAASGVLSEVAPHSVQPFSGNPKTPSERVPRPDQGSVISDLRARLGKASLRRIKMFADARRRRGRLSTNTESHNIWPPPKANQFPPVPLVETNCTSFTCQFCCQDLPAFFSDAHAWREHFLKDLSPYICVLPNCPQSRCVYGTQSDWEAHMKSVAHDGFRGRVWSCKVCLEDFTSMDSLLLHLRVDHVHTNVKDVDAQSLPETISHIKLDLYHLRDCFLCNEDLSKVDVLNHVASCMEIAALKSLGSEQQTRANISIQIEEVDCAIAETPTTPLEISSDAGQYLGPPTPARRSSRRAKSVPDQTTDISDFRSETKRRSMDEKYVADLTEASELSRIFLEARSGRIWNPSSTDSELRSAKIRRLSKSASQGSAQYSTRLDVPRRKTSPFKQFRLSEGPPVQRSQMLERYLHEHEVLSLSVER